MTETLQIRILADGSIFVGDEPVSLEGLAEMLAALSRQNGQVLYYREGADEKPHPDAMRVLELIVENELPVSFSTRPDFSDYVDQAGQSHAR